jgi:hypothetical protein
VRSVRKEFTTNKSTEKLDEFVLQKWWMRRPNVNTIFAALQLKWKLCNFSLYNKAMFILGHFFNTELREFLCSGEKTQIMAL